MKIAINQPFTFPYIGFYQLVTTVDKFIFYDDVTFMKQSWINRNRILINGKDTYFTLQLESASSYKLISETEIKYNPLALNKLYKTFQQAYAKAPYVSDVLSLIMNWLNLIQGERQISKIAYLSIQCICDYLGIETIFEFSSEKYSQTQGLGRKERLYEILRLNNATDYVNLPGGTGLYSKEEFIKQGFQLHFIDRGNIIYKQFSNEFVPWLSIIDVLMFNSKDETNNLLAKCTLV
jgi:hypothetical protein